MINPEDETIIVNSISCSKDEAVAKMLGWMRSPVRLKYIKVSSLGIQPDQLEHMHSIEGSILDLLNEQREIARNVLLDLAEEAATTQDDSRRSTLHDLINQKDSDIVMWQSLINKASSYLHAIDTELTKGKNSTLKTEDTSCDNDEPLIILDSLDKWANANFGITVREEFDVANSAGNSVFKEPQRADPLREEIIEILSNMPNPRPAKVMAALKARIGTPGTCIVGDIGYGVKWTNNKNEEIEFNMKLLTARLKTLRKR